MPQGRHRPKTYTLPLVDTWEAMRSRYTRPTWLAWLTRWWRRG